MYLSSVCTQYKLLCYLSSVCRQVSGLPSILPMFTSAIPRFMSSLYKYWNDLWNILLLNSWSSNNKSLSPISVKQECTSVHDLDKYIHVQSLKRSTFPLERWANAERTLNEHWTHAEWTVCERRTEFGERYANGERWANAEREQSANASAKWTMNARWMQDERSIRKASCVFFSTKYLIIPR